MAASCSRLLRTASIYIGLLMVGLAGPGVVAGLTLLDWEASFEVGAGIDDELAGAVGRAGILILMAFVGAIIVTVEGSAIGVTLVAGRVLDRSIALREALHRSRRVFWRLVRAGVIVGLVQLAVSHAWQVAIGVTSIGNFETLTSEPIPSAIATAPLLYATVAIVLADDGARAGLRRSIRIARSAPLLTGVLMGFGLLSGFVQAFALGSGLDLIVRLTDALHLDITAGGSSFLAGAVLALVIVMAAGSLLFTVSAVVSAPQVVAWTRLGLPVDGLLVSSPAPTEPVEPPAVGAFDAVLGAADRPVGPIADAVEPAPEPVVEPAPEPAAEPPPTADSWGAPAPPAQAPSAWAAAAAAPPRFRWVTVPMILTIAAMWLIAGASLIGGAAR
ncbi:MAG: hypothetical protein AB1736_07105 [Chloroflexota bacterium]